MKWLIQRLQEPSTHAGIGIVLTALSTFLPQYAPIITGVASLFGFGAVVTAEKSKPAT